MSKFSLQVSLREPQDSNVFCFFVGQNRYECSETLAAVKCTKVRLQLLCDPTANFIQFPYQDPHCLFADFWKFIRGEAVVINASNIDFLARAAEYFGCYELLRAISDVKEPAMTVDWAMNVCLQAESLVMCLDEAVCLARSFRHVIARPDALNLPLFVLDAVLSSNNLCTDGISERDIFRFVSSVVARRGLEFVPLFAHVSFDQLDRADVAVFLRQVPREAITGALWDSVSQRLLMDVRT